MPQCWHHRWHHRWLPHLTFRLNQIDSLKEDNGRLVASAQDVQKALATSTIAAQAQIFELNQILAAQQLELHELRAGVSGQDIANEVISLEKLLAEGHGEGRGSEGLHAEIRKLHDDYNALLVTTNELQALMVETTISSQDEIVNLQQQLGGDYIPRVPVNVDTQLIADLYAKIDGLERTISTERAVNHARASASANSAIGSPRLRESSEWSTDDLGGVRLPLVDHLSADVLTRIADLESENEALLNENVKYNSSEIPELYEHIAELDDEISRLTSFLAASPGAGLGEDDSNDWGRTTNIDLDIMADQMAELKSHNLRLRGNSALGKWGRVIGQGGRKPSLEFDVAARLEEITKLNIDDVTAAKSLITQAGVVGESAPTRTIPLKRQEDGRFGFMLIGGTKTEASPGDEAPDAAATEGEAAATVDGKGGEAKEAKAASKHANGVFVYSLGRTDTGLRIGDRLMNINGRDVSTLGVDMIRHLLAQVGDQDEVLLGVQLQLHTAIGMTHAAVAHLGTHRRKVVIAGCATNPHGHGICAVKGIADQSYHLFVVEVIPGSAGAINSNIGTGDKIVKVNGMTVNEHSLINIVTLLSSHVATNTAADVITLDVVFDLEAWRINVERQSNDLASVMHDALKPEYVEKFEQFTATIYMKDGKFDIELADDIDGYPIIARSGIKRHSSAAKAGAVGGERIMLCNGRSIEGLTATEIAAMIHPAAAIAAATGTALPEESDANKVCVLLLQRQATRLISIKKQGGVNMGFQVDGPNKILAGTGQNNNIYVGSVAMASPAEQVGLFPGDRILWINGMATLDKPLKEVVKHVVSANDAVALYVTYDPKGLHNMQEIREARRVDGRLRKEKEKRKQESKKYLRKIRIAKAEDESFGMMLTGDAVGEEEGVTVKTITKGLAADRAGLRAGDRVLMVNGNSCKGMNYQGVGKLIAGHTIVVLKVINDIDLVEAGLKDPNGLRFSMSPITPTTAKESMVPEIVVTSGKTSFYSRVLHTFHNSHMKKAATLAKNIAQLEKEIDAANAAKDRQTARKLLERLDKLEAEALAHSQLKAENDKLQAQIDVLLKQVDEANKAKDRQKAATLYDALDKLEMQQKAVHEQSGHSTDPIAIAAHELEQDRLAVEHNEGVAVGRVLSAIGPGPIKQVDPEPISQATSSMASPPSLEPELLQSQPEPVLPPKSAAGWNLDAIDHLIAQEPPSPVPVEPAPPPPTEPLDPATLHIHSMSTNAKAELTKATESVAAVAEADPAALAAQDESTPDTELDIDSMSATEKAELTKAAGKIQAGFRGMLGRKKAHVEAGNQLTKAIGIHTDDERRSIAMDEQVHEDFLENDDDDDDDDTPEEEPDIAGFAPVKAKMPEEIKAEQARLEQEKAEGQGLSVEDLRELELALAQGMDQDDWDMLKMEKQQDNAIQRRNAKKAAESAAAVAGADPAALTAQDESTPDTELDIDSMSATEKAELTKAAGKIQAGFRGMLGRKKAHVEAGNQLTKAIGIHTDDERRSIAMDEQVHEDFLENDDDDDDDDTPEEEPDIAGFAPVKAKMPEEIKAEQARLEQEKAEGQGLSVEDLRELELALAQGMDQDDWDMLKMEKQQDNAIQRRKTKKAAAKAKKATEKVGI